MNKSRTKQSYDRSVSMDGGMDGLLSPRVVLMRMLGRFRFFATSRSVSLQAPLSMEFSRQEYWSGLPFPTLGDLPDSGMEPESLALEAVFFTTVPPGKP